MKTYILSSPAKFTEGLRRVVHAASQDETRPTLCSVALLFAEDNRYLCATDTHRLALQRVAMRRAPEPVILGYKGIAKLLKRKTIAGVEQIAVEKDEETGYVLARFLPAGIVPSSPKAIGSAVVIDGTYPDVFGLIAHQQFTERIELAAGEALAAVEAARGGKLEPVDGPRGKPVMDVRFEFPRLEGIRFRLTYAADIVAALPERLVIERQADPRSPCRFASSDVPGYVELLCSMNLPKERTP